LRESHSTHPHNSQCIICIILQHASHQ
jgi:hypothetical protein